MFACPNQECSNLNCELSEDAHCVVCGISLLSSSTIDRPFNLVGIDYSLIDFEAEVDKLTSSDLDVPEVTVNVDLVEPVKVLSFETDDTIGFIDKQIDSRFKRSKQPIIFDYNLKSAVIPKRINNNFTQVLNSENIGLQMQYVPSGTYNMGTEDSNALKETPTRSIDVPSFYVSTYLITQLQYQALMGINPAKFTNFSSPVEQVSFFDAIEYCRILKSKTGKNFRLLSEAEWEYACRANTRTAYSFGDEIDPSMCCYSPISRNLNRQHSTVTIGSYKPNSFGLYDMHGNVWEWCLDNWHRDYKNAPQTHQPWLTENNNLAHRIIRGGAWNEPDIRCRSASRDRVEPNIKTNNIGFRVACEI